MNVFFPWMVIVAYQTYQHGYKQGKFPEPYYFVGATAAMGICAIVAQANENFGTLLAWGLVVGNFVYGNFVSTAPNTETQSKTTPNNTGTTLV
jgi:hypothetical protein